MDKGICTIVTCERPALNKGLCSPHYQRQRRGADLFKPVRQNPRKGHDPIEWFWQGVDRSGSGCHEWTRSFGHWGYGHGPKIMGSTLTHRIAWMLTHGPIPNGLQVLHHCDNPPCCNPEHLFLGTQGDNMADMNGKGRHGTAGTHKTHCRKGHEFTPENTYVNRTLRQCYTCKRENQRLYYLKYRDTWDQPRGQS